MSKLMSKSKILVPIILIFLMMVVFIATACGNKEKTFEISGNVNFQTSGANAAISAEFENTESNSNLSNVIVNDGTISAESQSWQNLSLSFKQSATAVLKLKIENLSSDEIILFRIENQNLVDNLSISLKKDNVEANDVYFEVAPTQTQECEISFSVNNADEDITSQFNLNVEIINGNDAQVEDIEVKVLSNFDTFGSVQGGGYYDVGDTISLTATENEGIAFMAWATSTDPKTMQILSTSPSYTFTFGLSSPRTIYALFNATTEFRFESGDIRYTLYKETKLAEVTATYGVGATDVFEIPATVSDGATDYQVYSVADNAFWIYHEMETVKFPSTIYKFGDFVFAGAYNIKYFEGEGNSYYQIYDNKAIITDGETIAGYAPANPATEFKIPENVKYIGTSAFRNSQLKVVDASDSNLISIGESAFEECRQLTSIILPNSLESISNNAFRNCSNLGGINLPSTLQELGFYAFYGCENVKSVVLPESLETIEIGTFEASGIESIVFPSNLKMIEESAFANCEGLTRLELPEGVERIGNHCFSSCTNLEYIYLPDSISSVGAVAFYGCTKLTSIDLPANVTVLSGSVFAESGLTSIVIPNTVARVESNALSGCENLEQITLLGNTYVDFAAIAENNVQTLIIGADVTDLSNILGYGNLEDLTKIVVEEGSACQATIGYGSWEKNGEIVNEINGAGTYVRVN